MPKLISALLIIISLAACSKPQHPSCPLPSTETEAMTMQELKPEYQKLLKAAITATDKSYAPYSKFYVASAVLLSDGEIITGNNVENASYGLTICAERAAILRANASGKRNIVAIAITAVAHDVAIPVTEPVAPCGACRQVIFEFSQISNHDIDVIMSNTDGSKVVIKTISELLPMAFGPKDLS
jgi:cytidine deaminase